MRHMQEKVLIIVPCYNEEKRLQFKPFQDAPSNHYFLFVNDGSTDGTVSLMLQNTSDNIMLLDLEKNGGKAEAVRRGLQHARSLPLFNQIEWIGYWDADLATPINEVSQFLLYQEYFAPNAEAIFGSRVLRMGSTIERSLKRHIFGRFFATVVSNLFGFKSYDTQCGAKLFRKGLVDKISREPFISSWIFDVEVVLRLKGHHIVEYPLSYWVDVQGSKLSISKVAFRIFKDLWKIKRAYRDS
jgi:glycosyltransferase involved in cell wall biosynthesis